jgi:hypothetical protein
MIALCFLMFAEFAFDDFSSTQGLQLVSDAGKKGSVLRLTRAEDFKSGAAWFVQKQAVANGFETTFRFQLTDQGGLGDGADGFAFVLQSVGPNAIAGRGSAGGFALGDGVGDRRKPGIPNSIAVFFDTFRNRDGKDPSDNYIAICTIGRPNEMKWPPPRLALNRKLKFELKDGKAHAVRIGYKPPILTVDVDGAQVLMSPVDLATVLDESGQAYIGFTASTGAGYENHDILNWSFQSAGSDVASDLWQSSSTISYIAAACLEGRNLCTPERSIVEEKGAGEYHIVLPAHLEWGASIPNADGKPVAILNAHGTVCWDFEARGAEGCSGPKGALITRDKDGRTHFSVKDSGDGFKDNQGYFEFDVRVQ